MVGSDDDVVIFADEAVLPEEQSWVSLPRNHWKVLIVDDDEDVHISTEFSLKSLLFLERPLLFLHAYSSAEAFKILSENPDIAVMLLDVVMESEDAGLQLVHRVREELKLDTLRIILRTGQPGYAPEIETIEQYDINDYKTKGELTRARLYSSLMTAIRSFEQLQKIDKNRIGLSRIISATNSLMQKQGLRDFSEGVINQLAAFIGIEPDGLVCFQALNEELNPGSVRVIASAGRYIPWMDEPHFSEDHKVWSRVQECFMESANIVHDDSTCLYFEPTPSQRYVVYVDAVISLSQMDEELIKMFAHNISLCAQNIGLVEQLQTLAYQDTLTGLCNRNGLLRLLEELPKPCADSLQLIMIDIDQFSVVNDTFGHRHGDLLLQRVSEMLSTLKGLQSMARLGSDHFALLLEKVPGQDAEVRRLFMEPVEVNDTQHLLTVCTSEVTVDQSVSASDLLGNAVIALKRAKLEGQSQHMAFSKEMGQELRARAMLLSELKQDLQQEGLHLVYQPQVELETGQVLGFEALLRWKTRKGDMISPDLFIPLAERSGLILTLGAWVLRQALQDLKSVRALLPDLRVAVNVSAVQFNQADFENVVAQALQDSELDGNVLDLEITESAGILGSDAVEAKLQELKKLGVIISIDDFGTGFSSLSYLEQLSADRLKIDRNFVAKLSSPSGRRIAEAIVNLGRQLRLQVLAEGIEDLMQLDELKRLGCHQGQGYLIARPMPIEQLESWLKQVAEKNSWDLSGQIIRD